MGKGGWWGVGETERQQFHRMARHVLARLAVVEAERDALREKVRLLEMGRDDHATAHTETVMELGRERDAARAQVAAVVSILHDIERQSDNRVGIPALEKAAAAHDAEVSRRARAEVLERLAVEWGNDAGAQVVRRFAASVEDSLTTGEAGGRKA